jgi:hypothetical protein
MTKPDQADETAEDDADFLAYCEAGAANVSPFGMSDLPAEAADRLFGLAKRPDMERALRDRKPQCATVSGTPGEWAALIRAARERLSAQ